MTKSILPIFCLFFVSFYNVNSASDIQSPGGLLHSVETVVEDDAGDDVGKLADDTLLGQENQQKSRTAEAKVDDVQWVDAVFEDYVDEDNQTVVFLEDSPIKVVDEHVATGTDRAGRKIRKLIPIEKIPGTELFTGLFYKLKLKSFPRGWVVLSGAHNAHNFNFLQAENDPRNLLNNYGKDGSMEFANQWMLAPTEVAGSYNLISRSRPKSLATWTSPELASGYHISVADSDVELFKLQPGGIFRNESFFTLVSTEETDFYKLQMPHFPGWYATWANDKNGDYNNWIEISNKDFDHDSKFQFIPGAVTLDAKVSQFKFERSPEDIFKTSSDKTRSVLHVIDTVNPSNSTIEYAVRESQTRKSIWSFGFKESLGFSQSVSVEVSAIPLMAKAVSTLTLNVDFEANQQKTTETEQTFSIDVKIIIPPQTTVTGKIFYDWINNLELPFTATMSVTGQAQRIVNDGSGTIQNGPVPASFVEDFLKSSGEEYNYIGVSPNNPNVFLVEVSGVLKGAMGSKTIIAVDGGAPPGFAVDIKPNSTPLNHK